MIYYLEGPDGHGKTRLAEGLSTKLGLPYFHSGSRQSAATIDLLRQAIKNAGGNIIVDRFPPISEEIYSKAFNREISIDFIDYEDLLGIPYKVIFCLTTEPNISKEFKPHKSQSFMAKVDLNKELITVLYKNYFHQYLPDASYDWRVNTIDDLIRQLGATPCVEL